ncbi:MAG TPA: DUF4837 family protein [Candidatus Krumholzibacteria bacterium]|nr:DUF4837 family protein [Candidatus Krumholzibacteria bacterium]
MPPLASAARVCRAATITAWIPLALLVASCAQPPATGADDEILLLCEPPLTPSALEPLQHLCSTGIPWLAPEESRFRPTLAASGGAVRRPRDKTVIVVGGLDPPGTWSRALRDRIPDADRAGLAARGAGWFVWRDVWAAGQEVHLLLARGESALDSMLHESGTDLLRFLEQSMLARAEMRLQPYLKNSSAQACQQRHGFRLAFPPEYSAVLDLAPPCLVELAAPGPTRTIAVLRFEDVDAARMSDRDYLFAMQRLALGSLHGDTLVEPGASLSTREDPAERAVLRGMWRNPKDVGGGPVVTHFVYDAANRRLYAAQAQLFAPGRRKQAFLVELEAMLCSLRLEGNP